MERRTQHTHRSTNDVLSHFLRERGEIGGSKYKTSARASSPERRLDRCHERLGVREGSSQDGDQSFTLDGQYYVRFLWGHKRS